MLRRLPQMVNRPFVRNVVAVVSGTAASQAIAMAFAPLLTRLYGPETYGLQGVFLTITGLLGTVSTLSYPMAIVLPQHDEEALAIAWLSLIVGVLMTTGITTVLIFYGDEVLGLLNAAEILNLIYLIPAALFLALIGDILVQWLIRKQAFAFLARIRVVTTLLTTTTKAGLGFVAPSALALIGTSVIGSLLTGLLILRNIGSLRRNDPAVHRSLGLVRTIYRIARQHWDFPLLRTPQTLINALSQSLPVMLLAAYSGPAAVGFYSIALLVLALPSGLIGTSVMQVFYPRITVAMHRGEDIQRLIARATAAMAALGAVPFLLVAVSGPMLFGAVFGAGWEAAGVYSQILSPWLFLQYANKPAVAAIPALNLQGGLLVYELFSTGSKILALYLGFKVFESEIAAILLFSLVGTIAYLWLIFWVIKQSRRVLCPRDTQL